MRTLLVAALLACSAASAVHAQDDEDARDPLAPEETGRTARPRGERPEARPRGPATPPPSESELDQLRRDMRSMRDRLESLESQAGDERPTEPSTPDKVWAYAKENLRLSITLNNFYVYRDNSPLSVSGPTDDSSAFTVGQLELDIWSEHRFGIDFRVDIDTVEDDGGSIGGNGTFNHADDIQLEQAYIQVDFAKLLGTAPIRLTFGKFNAPMGFEPIDAPGLWQFSRTNLASLLTPANLVGAKAGYYSDVVDAEVYIANGWNVNDDPDREKTGGARITLKLLGDAGSPLITIAPAIIYGHESATSVGASDKRLVADIVVVVRPIDRVAIAFEGNFGHENDPIERSPLGGGAPIRGRDRAVWDAYLGSINVRLTEWFAVTLRGEYIRDRHGFHTGAVRQTGVAGPNYLKSGTAALCFKLPTGVGEVFDPLFINLEYRYDRSNRRLWSSRGPSSTGDETHSSTFAFQVFFYF